ncbi:uncharacterized protein LOC133202919 [Saccostrea echinata]|uniref:uncharacterized protein LOC133202919 n=1 Tax=Saccostrea echinata TaxID=191078 RepID=UPI002A822AD6|nr:uncharacterized protein LOC133202919 [Saccostrea echinata]
MTPFHLTFYFLVWIKTIDNTYLQAVNGSFASLSLDEMVSGFRYQQLQLSTRMMNASLHARLPEKMAAMQVQEAEERTARALSAIEDTQTPFIAMESRYNLGYIGRGYDLFKGNPLSNDGVVDQGFRLPVIDLPYSNKFTADGHFRIPDNVDVIAESSAKFGSSLYKVQSESDYKSMLSVDASVNAHGEGWGVSASFSASASYQKNTQQIQKGETTTLSIVSRAVVYRARMSETSKISKVSDYFEKAVMLLPMENCDNDSLQDMYLNFIREFGTHYTTQVVMGAKAVQQLTFSNSDLSKLESEGISAEVAAEASYSGFGASAGGGISVGVGSQNDAKQQVSNTNKEQYEYYIGGNPPAGDFSEGSTESLREWATSADEKPVPIQYKMTSIDTLLKPGYFNDITYGLLERRRCLRRALYTYCKQTVSPSLCNPPDDSYISQGTRRKRQAIDNTNALDIIKFGDFLTLENIKTRKFLALSNSTGYLNGVVTKPLVPVDRITNYDGLFQIKSIEGDSTTLGTPLAYGQIFKLASLEGEDMFIGRQFIEDVSEAPESKLETAFEGKDRRKFMANGDLTDFSIFLKPGKKRPYLVSLKLRCDRSSSLQYQVNIEGTDRTAKFDMKSNCLPHLNGRWYHRVFTDKGIGEMQSVTFMGTEGLEAIIGFQIRTSDNRKVFKYKQDSLNLTGNEETIQMNTLETLPVEIEIYPAQFSFHSKNHPAGSDVRRQDIVFVEVVSAIDRKKFWGQPVSHLLSNKNQKVTIEEKEPAPHKIKSDCNGIIFPDNDGLGVGINLNNSYFVSFAVDVMINIIVIRTRKEFQANNFRVEYINRNSSRFQQLQNIIRNPNRGSTKAISIKFPKMYLSAIKVFEGDVVDFAQNVESILIRGCPSALLEEKSQDTSAEEWELRRSENQLQRYPFLRVVTTQQNGSNFDRIFEEMEKPFLKLNYRKDVTIDPNARRCKVDERYIQNYLMTSDEVEGLKFQNTRISSSLSSITIITDVMAMNKIMYEHNIPALDSLLLMSVQRYPCDLQQAPVFATQQSLEEKSSISTAGVISITVLAILVLLASLAIFVIFGVMRRRTVKKDSSVHVRQIDDESVFENDDRKEEAPQQIYTNREYDVEEANTASSFPPRQRRMT